jgi:galactonate dehydratase
MKITAIKSYVIHPSIGKNLLFVKVETNEGITGWGECYTQADRDIVIQSQLQQLARYLRGRDPFEIKRFTHMVYEDWATKRGSMELFCAVSGIEQALWDILGKQLNQPVYNLLGGPCRKTIRVYANGWTNNSSTLEELCAQAKATVKRGFTALKFDPFPGPWRLFITRKEENEAIRKVEAVRAVVGPNVDILIEVHRRLAPMHAIRIAKSLEEYSPFWYEEPVPSENIDALRLVKDHVDIPIVTGECIYTKSGFRTIFEKSAVDIINPDICNTGGILELKEIAAMAEPYYVAVAPHNYNSTIFGLGASLQAAAVIPNFLILEYFLFFESLANDIAVNPFTVKNGYIKLSKCPGLGIQLKEDALSHYKYKEFPKRHIDQYLS